MKTIVIFVALFVVSAWASSCPVSGSKSGSAGRCPFAAVAVGSVPESTNRGCSCSSNCVATTTTGLANCDWCYTQNGCGRSGLSGSWDYCSYPSNNTFQSQTVAQKMSFLWSQVTANQQNTNSYPNILNIFGESIQTSFDLNRDWFPDGRIKVIHSMGAVCSFNMPIVTSSPYSGVFLGGSTAMGFIRMGSATPVTTTSGIAPGLCIKFVRSGVKSGNYVALVDLNPTKNYNFFQNNFSNHIAPPSGVTAILAKKFGQASNCVSQVGLSDICKYTTNGQMVQFPQFPFRLEMVPRVQWPNTPYSQAGLQAKLAAIGSNTPLFDVYAYADPEDDAPMKLGTMTTTTQCVNSLFGDTKMFFQHQRIEDDWALQPGWLKSIDAESQCGTTSLSIYPPTKCSSYKNL